MEFLFTGNLQRERNALGCSRVSVFLWFSAVLGKMFIGFPRVFSGFRVWVSLHAGEFHSAVSLVSALPVVNSSDVGETWARDATPCYFLRRPHPCVHPQRCLRDELGTQNTFRMIVVSGFGKMLDFGRCL